MAKRARKRSPRLPLPWEREDSLLRGMFSGRRVLPFVLQALNGKNYLVKVLSMARKLNTTLKML